jgi:DNA polymerase III subunit gamma/tau
MSYTALARKWRPKKFAELVGQEHVRRALVNALETGRVHHAFLFTGTRGVGKTTIARIFAKCLNCEIGVTPEPCGVCAACKEIDSGRFVDLIEVDAASRTKVDDTRELLDNVQYAPTRGRYKVYLIDEVHMLSTHSFNALLKTLEEPPPHVKFLLATTDPQKLPVTVLSRCLQFNLKRMPVGQIAEHMKLLLEKEGVPFEVSGLRLVAQAADGSMRDGLSLLDQLIAFGGGKAGEDEARAMLGTISRDHVERLAELLGSMNVPELMKCASSLEEFAPDYAQVLDELAGLLVRVAMKQTVTDYEGDDLYAPELLERLAKALAPEDIQLFYQTTITGRRDLGLAPDPRTGFEMTLLRMIAFRPANDAAVAQGQVSGAASGAGGRGAAAAALAAAGGGANGASGGASGYSARTGSASGGRSGSSGSQTGGASGGGSGSSGSQAGRVGGGGSTSSGSQAGGAGGTASASPGSPAGGGAAAAARAAALGGAGSAGAVSPARAAALAAARGGAPAAAPAVSRNAPATGGSAGSQRDGAATGTGPGTGTAAGGLRDGAATGTGSGAGTAAGGQPSPDAAPPVSGSQRNGAVSGGVAQRTAPASGYGGQRESAGAGTTTASQRAGAASGPGGRESGGAYGSTGARAGTGFSAGGRSSDADAEAEWLSLQSGEGASSEDEDFSGASRGGVLAEGTARDSTSVEGASAGSASTAGSSGGHISSASAAKLGTSAGSPSPGSASGAGASAGADFADGSWVSIMNQLDLGGAPRQLASHCVLVGKQPGIVRLAIDPRVKFVRTTSQEEKLAQALSRYYGETVHLEFSTASWESETPAQAEQRASQQELEVARQAFETDPGVKGLRERFGATLLPDTIRPVK